MLQIHHFLKIICKYLFEEIMENRNTVTSIIRCYHEGSIDKSNLTNSLQWQYYLLIPSSIFIFWLSMHLNLSTFFFGNLDDNIG